MIRSRCVLLMLNFGSHSAWSSELIRQIESNGLNDPAKCFQFLFHTISWTRDPNTSNQVIIAIEDGRGCARDIFAPFSVGERDPLVPDLLKFPLECERFGYSAGGVLLCGCDHSLNLRISLMR